MKPRLVMIVVVMLLVVGLQAIIRVDADSLKIQFDDLKDVMYSNNINENNTTFVKTQNPDCDIANFTIFLHSKNNKMIVILNMNPKGHIINQNDLNSSSNPQKEGRSVFYYGIVQTTIKTYYFRYSNHTCHTTTGGYTDDYAIYDNQLIIIMNLTQPDEQIIYSGAYCYDLRNDSEKGIQFFIDYVPNDLMVNVGINTPYSAVAGEEVTFKASYYDIFNTLEEPFVCKLDFGDGNGATGQSVTHTYQETGVYTIRLFFNDSAGHYAYREAMIDVNRPIYNRYQVTWTKRTDSLDIYNSLFITKNQLNSKNYAIHSPADSVLTQVQTTLEWTDDHSYGLDGSKGLDTLEASLQVGIQVNNYSSIGSGKQTFINDIYSVPNDFIVFADTTSEAEQEVKSIMQEKNNGFFHLEVTVTPGEKIFRFLKFLQDQGNPIDVSATYEYYTYDIRILPD